MPTGKTGTGRTIEIGFTDLLYAAVISLAIAEIKDFTVFVINSPNVMLFFSLLIIFDDWLLYHLEIRKMPDSVRTYSVMYVLDIVVIITWYLLFALPKGDIKLFMTLLLLFFAVVSVWEIAFNVQSSGDLLRKSDIPLIIAYSVLLVIHIFSNLSAVAVLIIAIVAFVVSRTYLDWITLLREEPAQA